MSPPSNQFIERYYFEQFAQHIVLPAGQIEYSDKPDVLIHGEKLLGIEIANLYLSEGSDPNSEQVQRRRREAVLAKAQETHRASGGRRIELHVDFRPDRPIRSIESVASGLAKVARRIESNTGGQIYREYFEDVPELRFLYHNGQEYENSKWMSVQGSTVPSLSIERVRELVARKSHKVASYRPCDKYWLLLVVDFMDFAQDQDITWPDNALLGETPFERVLLYKPQFKQVAIVPR